MCLYAKFLDDISMEILTSIFVGSSAIHLLMILGELSLPHASAHGRMAVEEILSGKFRGFFWLSIVLASVGLLAPWGGGVGLVCGLMGLALYEHVYVQAGQVVPLA